MNLIQDQAIVLCIASDYYVGLSLVDHASPFYAKDSIVVLASTYVRMTVANDLTGPFMDLIYMPAESCKLEDHFKMDSITCALENALPAINLAIRALLVLPS